MNTSRTRRFVVRASAADDDDDSSETSPHEDRRTCGLSPRAYQAQVDLCRLWELMLQNRNQAEIARIMGKDPAWVCRSVRRIREDRSVVFLREKEANVVDEQLARFEALFSKAFQMIEDGEGMAKVAAIRTAATILREKYIFMTHVGLVRQNQENPPALELARGLWG